MLRVIEVPVDHYVRQLDELSSAQPRHVIERLIDHEQHPALRQIEAEVAQIEAQVAQASEQVEPIPEPPLPEPRPMSRVRPHERWRDRHAAAEAIAPISETVMR